MNHTIVAADAIIGKNVTLSSGSVIGFNVVIGDDKIIPNNVKIAENPIVACDAFDGNFGDDSDSDSDEEEGTAGKSQIPSLAVKNVDLVGEDGKGYVYESDVESDSYEDESIGGDNYSGIIYQMKTLNFSDESIASVTNKRTKSSKHKRRHSTNSMVSESGAGPFDSEFEEDEEEDFAKEGYATVNRAIENNHDIDTALLELNTLRMSMNVTYHEVRSVTTEALINKIVDFIATDTLKPQEAATKIFNRWGSMFKRQVFSPEEEIDLLNILESKISVLDKSYNQVILFLAVKTLYDLDVVEEDNILAWWNQGEDSEVRTLTTKFITWLEEADEEESDDDEDDSE